MTAPGDPRAAAVARLEAWARERTSGSTHYDGCEAVYGHMPCNALLVLAAHAAAVTALREVEAERDRLMGLIRDTARSVTALAEGETDGSPE